MCRAGSHVSTQARQSHVQSNFKEPNEPTAHELTGSSGRRMAAIGAQAQSHGRCTNYANILTSKTIKLSIGTCYLAAASCQLPAAGLDSALHLAACICINVKLSAL